MYAQDPHEPMYRLLINKQQKAELKHFKDPKVFIEYSSHVNDVCESIEEYNSGKKRKVLILIVDVISKG